MWSDSEDRDQREAYVAIEDGQYGYRTNDTCQLVSIPVSAFQAANPHPASSSTTFHRRLGAATTP